MHGIGTKNLANGEINTGEFSNDMYNCQGTHTWPSHEIHVGQWRADK